MKEKIKQLIANQLLRQAEINVILQNLSSMGNWDEELINQLLDEKQKTEDTINKLSVYLKSLSS